MLQDFVNQLSNCVTTYFQLFYTQLFNRSMWLPHDKCRTVTVSMSGFVRCLYKSVGRRLHLQPSKSRDSSIDCLLFWR